MIRRPRGTQDIGPDEVRRWQWVESAARETARHFGFHEARTPTFEEAALFERGVGDTTDVVQKEMYRFRDRGDRLMSLRPESTAGIVRAFVENHWEAPGLPVKLYYIQSHFRYERPQQGRYREHHQFGVEVFGAPGAQADAEVILLAVRFLERLGAGQLRVLLNSIGCEVCRPAYRAALVAYYAPRVDTLCPDCQRRLEHNPLRLLDCKVPADQALKSGAPRSREYLCATCTEHEGTLTAHLTALGVPWQVDATLVRGLDYYTRTVFEVHGQEGFAIVGGGRYDRLMAELGGPSTPGVGFGLGIERLLHYLESAGLSPPVDPSPRVFVAARDEQARRMAWVVADRLRQAGIAAEWDLLDRSLKAQFRIADRAGASHVVILGPAELSTDSASVRDLRTSQQVIVPMDALVGAIRRSDLGQQPA